MDKLTAADVSVTRIQPSGALEVAAMVNGYRESRVYYGYNKREAVRRFMAEMHGMAGAAYQGKVGPARHCPKACNIHNTPEERD